MFAKTIKLLLMSKFIQTETKPKIVKVSVEPTILVGDGTNKVKSLVDGSIIENDRKILQFAVPIDSSIIKKLEKENILSFGYPKKNTEEAKQLLKDTFLNYTPFFAEVLTINDKKDDDKTQVITLDLGKKGDTISSLEDECKEIKIKMENEKDDDKENLLEQLKYKKNILEAIRAVTEIEEHLFGFSFIIFPKKIKSIENEKPLCFYTKIYLIKGDSLEETDGSQLVLPEWLQKSFFSGWVLYLVIGCVVVVVGGLILYFVLKKKEPTSEEQI